MENDFRSLLDLPPGPRRTAALVAWFQALYVALGEEPPVLVGGAAVELYTGGAYTTGDLDFVGVVPEAVAERLRAEGFSKEGRLWVHSGDIYIELPGRALETDERKARLDVGDGFVELLSPEDLIVDRLAAWKFWRSEVDGVNAYLIYRAQRDRIDGDRLRALAAKRRVTGAYEELERFGAASGFEASPEELSAWAKEQQ